MAYNTVNEIVYQQWKYKEGLPITRCTDQEGFSLRENVHSLKSLRVAVVLDPFSYFSYAPECDILNLDGEHYLEELEQFQPDMFFFESAWDGKNSGWKSDVRNASSKFREVVAWCRAHRIPVVFWNKEDPGFTKVFIKTAALADYVFTTEADLIPQYKAWLGHERVYHLHFAAQAQQHNPTELFDRKNKICFAGAWYNRYPYRNVILDHYITMLKPRLGVDIYDRNYGNENAVNKYPPEYTDYILGSLPPDEIDIAYKGYVYGLNMNSGTETSTMFARRVFELGASNTLIVSNYSYGLKRYFGDLLICTDDMDEAAAQFDKYYIGRDGRRLRLLMLRKTLREHLYEDRLDRIVSIAFGVHLKRQLPDVYIVDIGNSEAEHERIQDNFDRQTYAARHLIRLEEIEDVPDNAFVGVFSPNDHYGDNYIMDMMLSLRYCNQDGFVKPVIPDDAYRPAQRAALRRALIRMDVLRAQKCMVGEDEEADGQFLCVDEFNYQPDCSENWTEELDDIQIENQGLSIQELEAEVSCCPEWQELSLDDMAQRAAASDTETVHTNQGQQNIFIGNYAEKGVCYKKLTGNLLTENYSVINDGLELCFHMDTLNGEEAVGACFFITDGVRVDIGPVFLHPNKPQRVVVPKKCSEFWLGVRVNCGSVIRLSGISLRKNFKPLWFNRMRQSDTMILTNIYPRYDNLYRNMFVHERVRQYTRQNHPVQVFCLNDRVPEQTWRFEGQDVFSVHSSGLDLALRQMKTICTHVLTAPMWEVLKKHLHHIRLIVWIHGSEIQPYTRRLFNYEGGIVPDKDIQASNDRKKLWKEVFAMAEEAHIRFVCVSNFFAKMISEDYGLSMDYIHRNFIIIHNNVDEKCFMYKEKTEEHRLHLLSIRPYGSRTYANDLTVQCISELAKRPFFGELQFSVYGDGVLFDDVTAPLHQYENVTVTKRFLTHEEIEKIYERHGILMVPTRTDTQGLSRDEAMHAGLVPVTNTVAAIPEFCDETCAILAPGEDYMAMADGIEKLYRDPELFLRMSKAASETSHRNTSFEVTIQKEIDLIFYDKK